MDVSCIRENMRRPVLLPIIAACGLAFLLSACAPKKKPTRTTQPNPQSSVMTDADVRMAELRKRAEELNKVTQKLPAEPDDVNRKLVADAFGKASSALELLGGPTPGGAFRQQLRIIENTRTFLATGSGDVSVAPCTDSGLRSLENALTAVRERLFQNDDKVRNQIEALRGKLVELDNARGPIHSVVVAQAFQSAASVVDTMATELDSRAQANAASATQMLAQPASTQQR
jgi:hypothetical protein